MFRMALSLGVVAVLLTIAGCTMCCHPYDYCGPVYGDCGCNSCSPCCRTGSVLSGSSEPMLSSGQAQRQVRGQSLAHVPSQRQVQSGRKPRDVPNSERVASNRPSQGQVQDGSKPRDVPNSERIVSVTNRVVGPSVAADDSSQAATESFPTPPKPPVAQGWTARRTTRDAGQ
jgi:hypothetical protein